MGTAESNFVVETNAQLLLRKKTLRV